MTWLDKLPLFPLVVIAIMLALAPFVPEPHLLEKLKMLLDGSLQRPLDIFDLLMHATPLLLVVIKLIRRNKAKN
ncbi:MAG: RND transporter [Gammaproteobacteria bacterium]|nr:RND transporter [Gammaproteobacteria bacterium]